MPFNTPVSVPTPGIPLPAGVYDPDLAIRQNNQAIIEGIAAHEAQRKRVQQLIDEAIAETYIPPAPKINYTLGLHNGPAVERFVEAYAQLRAMLTGAQEMDFVKAVFLVESAYDPSLTRDEFSGMFNTSKTVIERLIVQDGLDPTDNLAKIMSIFKYMADTTEVYFPEREQPVATHPMLYDYEDYAGKEDVTKIFVSKLLRTGTGQCMSLPMLYFLYAKALDTRDVHIAMAPQHTFIVFRDKLGNRQNIELTCRAFTTDDFQWQGGFVKAPQVKSSIYLHPLTDQETIVYLMTTLAIAYVRAFGTDERVLDMALTAIDHFPNSLTARKLVCGYFQDNFNHIIRQYRTYRLPQEQLDRDQNVQAVYQSMNEAFDYLYEELGYEKIPDWHYQQWLESVKESTRRNEHLTKRRQLEQQLK